MYEPNGCPPLLYAVQSKGLDGVWVFSSLYGVDAKDMSISGIFTGSYERAKEEFDKRLKFSKKGHVRIIHYVLPAGFNQ